MNGAGRVGASPNFHRRYMKKANEKSGRMVTRTIDQIENRKITKAERERLKRVAALPDSGSTQAIFPK